jgi:glycerophosphoryl diester phosphodiesterase
MSAWLSDSTPLIIAHRGASHDAPENTITAFALAVEQGADGIELDVQLSADGIPVVMHDASVERTTNGRGAVSKLTIEQLQRLDAGDGRPVPTLDEVFEIFGPTLLYNVELKTGIWSDRNLAAAVAERIDGHHL